MSLSQAQGGLSPALGGLCWGLGWASPGLAQASGGDGWTDKWTDGQAEFLPILQDFVPIGPAALLHIHVNYQILKQGKGTADHMMPRATGLIVAFDFQLQ